MPPRNEPVAAAHLSLTLQDCSGDKWFAHDLRSAVRIQATSWLFMQYAIVVLQILWGILTVGVACGGGVNSQAKVVLAANIPAMKSLWALPKVPQDMK